ncbi:MAG: glutamate--tRNA ligase [Coriobacteriia bacterium]|nr:glutamate--tRNA ligase [Coriobacteriia bacterium]
MSERVRFSPSPTGALHLGGARTALFNRMLADAVDGVFVLRIEDTDAVRNQDASEDAILKGLRWLGITWDEGPDIGGPFAPYRQSERSDLYRTALARLRESRAVYPCFCSSERLAQDRADDAAAGLAPRYHGTCATLSEAERSVRLDAGEAHVWRFSVPASRVIDVEDAVHGTVRFEAADIGDFVIVRSDGTPVYDFACVLDDGAMHITTVLRGDDHLPNTPRQVLLHEALGQVVPRWAHVPLVTAADGAPLSKSRGAESMETLRQEGYLPLAVVNHIARLGWSVSEHGVLTLAELVSRFRVEALSRASAVHDPARLRALNAEVIHSLSPQQLAEAIAPFMSVLPDWISERDFLAAVQEELVTLSDVSALLAPVLSGLVPDEEARGALAADGAIEALGIMVAALRDAADVTPEMLARQLRDAAKSAGIVPRVALPALRAALTGRAHGLPISTLLGLLGVKRVRDRLKVALG